MANLTSIKCDSIGETSEGFLVDDDLAMEYCKNSTIYDACMSECQQLRCDELEHVGTAGELALEIVTKILTFLLVFGFAATVDHRYFIHNLKSRSVYIGVACQFVLMPLLGFVSVLIFQEGLPPLYAVILIVVTACPGGAYSNWLCSVFNADLALSVAMTSASTILAAAFLPLNVFLYVNLGYGNLNDNSPDDIVNLLPYSTLLSTLAIVIAAVLLGLSFGFKFPKRRHNANFVGNVAGVLLQAAGLFASGTSCSPPWKQSWFVIGACLFPLIVGLILAIFVSSLAQMPKPQQFAVAIETAYQNIGIAVAIALSLGSQGREAAVIPVLYGVFEAVVYLPYCFASLFAGWSLSPKGEYLWKVLVHDYQDLIEVHPDYATYRSKFDIDEEILVDHLEPSSAKVTEEGTATEFALTDANQGSSSSATSTNQSTGDLKESKTSIPRKTFTRDVKGRCAVFGFYLF